FNLLKYKVHKQTQRNISLESSTLQIAIQGIKGSYHYQVAQHIFGKDVGIIECMSFIDLVKSILEGVADQGVLALENSIAGAILPNYDLMDRNNLRITGEFYLPISHQL